MPCEWFQLGPRVLQYSSHRRPDGRATASGRYPRWAACRWNMEGAPFSPAGIPQAVLPLPGLGGPCAGLRAHTIPVGGEEQ